MNKIKKYAPILFVVVIGLMAAFFMWNSSSRPPYAYEESIVMDEQLRGSLQEVMRDSYNSEQMKAQWNVSLDQQNAHELDKLSIGEALPVYYLMPFNRLSQKYRNTFGLFIDDKMATVISVGNQDNSGKRPIHEYAFYAQKIESFLDKNKEVAIIFTKNGAYLASREEVCIMDSYIKTSNDSKRQRLEEKDIAIISKHLEDMEYAQNDNDWQTINLYE